MYRWLKIKDGFLPPVNVDVIFACETNADFSFPSIGSWTGKYTDGGEKNAVLVMDDGDYPKDWLPCSHWMPVPNLPGEI